MKMPNHQLSHLFEQIGLNSTNSAIEEFIESHQLPAGKSLEDAPFWNESQLQFFKETRRQDAVWVELVDELDVQLHKDSMKN